MKEEIVQILKEIVKNLTEKDISISLSIPKDSKNGDWASNVAFSLGKELGMSPLEAAGKLVNLLKENGKLSGIIEFEAVKPGFINFYLTNTELSSSLGGLLNAPEKIGRTTKMKNGHKAIVEYSSPNIAKPFTIGHLRSTIIGDAVANLLEAVGYEVYRDNHLGDWGTQFGKQIYAIKNIPIKDYPAGSNIEKLNEEEIEKSQDPIKDLVSLYVKFHEEAEKNPELEEEARKWFKKLEDGDSEARRLWQKCIDWSFKEFDRIYGELGVHFTENNGRGYGEAFFEDKMGTVIEELKEKGLLKEDKGAQLVYFENDKMPPLMILKKDGATLYATRDLATDKFRLSHYGKDILVINEVGAEQSLYWRQIFEIENNLGWYEPGQRIHIGHGMFRFKEGKMSTRKGNVIWLQDVLEEAEKRAFSLIKQDTQFEGSEVISTSKKPGKAARQNILGFAERANVSKQVAMGAIKWNDLKRNTHLDVLFDWDEVLSMQGNSGPYVQYSYTRTQSVLVKAGKILKGVESYTSYTPAKEETDILRKLYHFSEIIEDAAVTYSPNVVTEYLFELSQLFNNFYQKHRILNAPEEEKMFRLGLTEAVGTVLKHGLYLLGIQAPEKM